MRHVDPTEIEGDGARGERGMVVIPRVAEVNRTSAGGSRRHTTERERARRTRRRGYPPARRWGRGGYVVRGLLIEDEGERRRVWRLARLGELDGFVDLAEGDVVEARDAVWACLGDRFFDPGDVVDG